MAQVNSVLGNNSHVEIICYSGSVAQVLRLTGGEKVTETAKFADMFDKLFDCLNLSSFSARKMHENHSKILGVKKILG